MWRVTLTPLAYKQLGKLDHKTHRDITHYLKRLETANDPTHFGHALVGTLSGYWRYRVGKYRIICELQKNVLIVEVIEIGKRDKIYR